MAYRSGRALDDQVGAPTAVFSSELEVNLVVRHLALENQLVGRALVVGGNPERDSVAIDLALFDVRLASTVSCGGIGKGVIRETLIRNSSGPGASQSQASSSGGSCFIWACRGCGS